MLAAPETKKGTKPQQKDTPKSPQARVRADPESMSGDPAWAFQMKSNSKTKAPEAPRDGVQRNTKGHQAVGQRQTNQPNLKTETIARSSVRRPSPTELTTDPTIPSYPIYPTDPSDKTDPTNPAGAQPSAPFHFAEAQQVAQAPRTFLALPAVLLLLSWNREGLRMSRPRGNDVRSPSPPRPEGGRSICSEGPMPFQELCWCCLFLRHAQIFGERL